MRAGVGEPVVLIHPFALSRHVWDDVVDRLSDTHEVLAVTLAGHWGGAAVPWREVSVARYADEVERVMDEHGWSTAHVVGNSLGGWVAFELERRGRARSLTALAPAGGWRHVSLAGTVLGLRFLALWPFAALGGLLGDWVLRLGFVQRRVLKMLVHDVSAVQRDMALSVLRATTRSPAYLPTLWAGLRDGGVTGLGAVRTPTLLALCEHDRLLPRGRYGGMYMTLLPPHAERVVLAGVGHVPMLENPGLVADTIRAFIGRQAVAA